VEATEIATHTAETSDMGATHAVGETATSEMGGTKPGRCDPSHPCRDRSHDDGQAVPANVV